MLKISNRIKNFNSLRDKDADDYNDNKYIRIKVYSDDHGLSSEKKLKMYGLLIHFFSKIMICFSLKFFFLKNVV